MQTAKPQSVRAIMGILLPVVLLIPWLIYSTHELYTISDSIMVTDIAIKLSYLLVIYLYATKVESRPFLFWRDKKGSIQFYVISITLLFVSIVIVVIPAGIIAQMIASSHGFGFNLNPNVPRLIWYLQQHSVWLVVMALLAGIMEELIFRGFLIPRLRSLFRNNYLAVILSSLMFGFGHISYGTAINFTGPTVIGLIFGFYYLKYRNLKVLMICHFLMDYVAITYTKF